MSKDKKRLGRGLSALLNASAAPLTTGEMLEMPYTPGQAAASPAHPPKSNPFTIPGLDELHQELVSDVGTGKPVPAKQAPAASEEPARVVVHSAPASPPKTTSPKAQPPVDEGLDLSEKSSGPGYRLLPVADIQPNPWQPREEFDKEDIRVLADSLRTHGLLQSIVVRRAGAGYQVIAGERRLRAAMRLNWDEIPATIVEASDRDMAELALIENLQRKDLNPVEKAVSFQQYLERHGCTQDELAKRLNIDRSTIANFVRLLGLPISIQNVLRAGEISQGHARAILSLENAELQHQMCERVQTEGLSVRQTEAIVADWQAGKKDAVSGGTPQFGHSIATIPAPEKASRTKKKSSHILDLEQQLREALGLKVKLSATPGGRGKLEVFFKNHTEFESLIDYLSGE